MWQSTSMARCKNDHARLAAGRDRFETPCERSCNRGEASGRLPPDATVERERQRGQDSASGGAGTGDRRSVRIGPAGADYALVGADESPQRSPCHQVGVNLAMIGRAMNARTWNLEARTLVMGTLN